MRVSALTNATRHCGALVDDSGVAQPWPMLPAQMERFLHPTFLVVREMKFKSPNAGARMRR